MNGQHPTKTKRETRNKLAWKGYDKCIANDVAIFIDERNVDVDRLRAFHFIYSFCWFKDDKDNVNVEFAIVSSQVGG